MNINNIKGFILANSIDKKKINSCYEHLQENFDSKTAYLTRISVLKAL